jgi:hypothetical protein
VALVVALGATLAALAAIALVAASPAARATDGNCQTSGSEVLCTFPSGTSTWTVPEGVTQATFDVLGAQGGNGSIPAGGGGTGAERGRGGEATATFFHLVPSSHFQINVGTPGSDTGQGGTNGGGDGATNGGGGGASDVRVDPDNDGNFALADRIIVAGGGGGSDSGLSGGDGALGTGGAGGQSTACGGGGGYYGGGGGGAGNSDPLSACGGGGGGGSSYVSPQGSSPTLQADVNAGPGQVTITHPLPDTTAPTVISTFPSTINGTMGTMGKADLVTATFSEDVQNVNTSTFYLKKYTIDRRGKETYVPVTAKVTTPNAITAVLNPTKDLQIGTYQATITQGVNDKIGNALTLKTWYFKVTR